MAKNGSPTQESLDLKQTANAGYVRHVQASNCEWYTWLTDSVQYKKLYY